MKAKNVLAAVGLTAALLFTGGHEAEAGWGFLKKIENQTKSNFKGLGRAAKRLEKKTRRFRKTSGDFATFGYTRYQRHKAQAMADEAYARATKEGWEEKRFMEVNRLQEKHAYISEVIGQQKGYIADVSRAIEFQNIVLQAARTEINQRTLIRDLQLKVTSLMSDQDRALEVLVDAIGLNQMAIDGTKKSSESLQDLRVNHQISPEIEAGGLITDTTVVADFVTVSWDDSFIKLGQLAKSRNKSIKDYIEEMVKLGEKSELEQMVKLIVQVKSALMSLKSNIEADLGVNDQYAQSIIYKLVNTYKLPEPTPESIKASAEKREKEEMAMIEEMKKEREKSKEERQQEEAEAIAKKREQDKKAAAEKKKMRDKLRKVARSSTRIHLGKL